MGPDEYCREKAAQSGSSFYYSFLFLPLERRRAITALYAFCREVDDAVDEPSDPAAARAALQWWRGEVARLFAGDPQHPVTRALAPWTAAYGIDEARLNEIMDGMEMDLNQTRYLDFAALERYCYKVAGVVGLLSAEIFGYTGATTRGYAKDLGIAFQLGDDALTIRLRNPRWLGGMTLEAVRVGHAVATVYFSAASGTVEAQATKLAAVLTANLQKTG